MSLQNFSQLACDSILRLSLISFCNWLIRVFTKCHVPESTAAWAYVSPWLAQVIRPKQVAFQGARF